MDSLILNTGIELEELKNFKTTEEVSDNGIEILDKDLNLEAGDSLNSEILRGNLYNKFALKTGDDVYHYFVGTNDDNSVKSICYGKEDNDVYYLIREDFKDMECVDRQLVLVDAGYLGQDAGVVSYNLDNFDEKFKSQKFCVDKAEEAINKLSVYLNNEIEEYSGRNK